MDAGGKGIFYGDGGTTTAIVDSSGTFDNLSCPQIDDIGTIAFRATLDAGGDGVYSSDGGLITTISDYSGPFSFHEIPSISNMGTVAFVAGLYSGGLGIFAWANGVISTVVDPNGPFTAFGNIAVNDAGVVAFTGRVGFGGVDGIYVGPDPVADKVIEEGDSLFGSTLREIDFFEGFNNAGQIAFYAYLADGRQLIVRADPVPPAVYTFTGFFQPVDNLPALNKVNAGRAIPVKFSLGRDQGLDIFASGYPKSETILCDSIALTGGIEDTVIAGSSSQSCDAVTDRYTYVWKTERAWKGTCRQLVIKLSTAFY